MERIHEILVRYKIIIISIIALILGVLLVVLSSPQKSLISIFKEEVIRDIGITFILIGIAIIFYEHFIRMNLVELIQQIYKNSKDDLKKLIDAQCEFKSIKDSGLINVYSTEGSSEILNLARKNIKMLGITINYYFTPGGNEYKKLQQLVKNGCKLEILMLDSESEFVGYREKDEDNEHLKEQIELSFKIKKKFIEELPDEYKSNVKINFYDNYPVYSMTIIDDNLIRVTPFLYKKKGRACPTSDYIRKPGGVFEDYFEHFNDLWKSSHDAILSHR